MAERSGRARSAALYMTLKRKSGRGLYISSSPGHASFRPFWESLSLALIYPDRREEFRAWVASDVRSAADTVAAAVSQTIHAIETMYPKRIDEFDGLLRKGLDYCQQLLSDMGFDLEPRQRLIEALRQSSSPNVMLVPGCQTPDVLRSRVAQAAVLVKSAPKAWRAVIFSGDRPRRQGKTRYRYNFKSEQKQMEMMFDDLMGAASPRVNVDWIQPDSDATKTGENVQELVDRVRSLSSRSSVYVVSSTFHLVRVARELSPILRGPVPLGKALDQLVLVGSERAVEGSALDRSVHRAEYHKQMFFEIYRHLFETRIGRRSRAVVPREQDLPRTAESESSFPTDD